MDSNIMEFKEVICKIICTFEWECGDGIRRGFIPRKEWVKNKLLPFLCEGEYLDFLDVIPNRDKERVANELWEKLYDYSEGVETQEWNYTMEQLFRTENKRTPQETINRDIDTAIDFHLLIQRVLQDNERRTIQPVVDKIISALRSKDFKCINRYAYYELPPPYKARLEEFLYYIAKTYTISNKDYAIRQFIEALPKPTETTYQF